MYQTIITIVLYSMVGMALAGFMIVSILCLSGRSIICVVIVPLSSIVRLVVYIFSLILMIQFFVRLCFIIFFPSYCYLQVIHISQCLFLRQYQYDMIIDYLSAVSDFDLIPLTFRNFKSFQQIIGILMGTTSSPLLADLFHYSYEPEFV